MGWVRRHSKGALALGVCVLAAAGAGAAVIAVGASGGGGSTTATTGAYAPIKVTRPKIRMIGGGISGDVEGGVVTYLSTLMTQLPGRHHYGITLTNTSSLGFIDSLEWYPPTGVRILRVTDGSSGRCRLTGVGGIGGNQFPTTVLYPNILCTKVDLKAPSCTCLNDGGTVTFSFIADRDMGASGVARIISARLVFDPVPSYLSSATTQQPLSQSHG